MKIATVASLMIVLVVTPPAPSRADGAAATPGQLAGTSWHTIHIEGDSLFFLIDEIGVRFGNDDRFAARVRLVDRQQISKSGTYRTEGSTLIITIDGASAPKIIQYSMQGPDLIASDKAFGVTVKLVPGTMAADDWF